MILKRKDDQSHRVEALQQLLQISGLTKAQRDAIGKEIAILRSGEKGEREAAYHIDFGWKDGTNSAVIHDLRIEHNGRVAQIDRIRPTNRIYRMAEEKRKVWA